MRNRLLVAALLAAVFISTPASAQYRPFVGTVGSVNLDNQGFAQYNAPSSAKTLADTPSAGVVIHPWAQTAIICTEVAAIRFKTSGTPTASEGTKLNAGSCIAITNRSRLDAFKFIQASAGAEVSVDYGW